MNAMTHEQRVGLALYARDLVTIANDNPDQARDDDGKWTSGGIHASYKKMSIDRSAAELKARGYTQGKSIPWKPGDVETKYEVHHPVHGTKVRSAKDIQRYLTATPLPAK